MGELPAGTLTMLFTDIEGSTALVGRLGNRYGEALSAQRSGDPGLLATTLEMSAANAAQLGEALRAARLAGAAEAVRHKTGIPIKQPELLERFLGPARPAIAAEEWDAELAAGRALSQQQAAALLGSGYETPFHQLRDMA